MKDNKDEDLKSTRRLNSEEVSRKSKSKFKEFKKCKKY